MMYQNRVRLAAVFLLLTCGACTNLNSFSMTQVPSQRTAQRVKVTASSGGVFGIFGDNDFADDAYADLLAQCPGGKLMGVVTKQESTGYVVWVSRKITASAYCLPADHTMSASAGPIPPNTPTSPPAPTTLTPSSPASPGVQAVPSAGML